MSEKEILFRGQDKNGNWHFGDLVHEAFDGTSMLIPIGIREKINGHYCYPIEVIPETVGQFIGISDKNGLKIFDGDICIVLRELSDEHIDKHIGIVEWNSINKSYYFKSIKNEISRCFGGKEIIEVIGNIHDNPKLLIK